MWDRRPPSNFRKPRRKQSGYSPAHTTSTLTLLQTSRVIRLSPLVLFFFPSRACHKPCAGSVGLTGAALHVSPRHEVYTFLLVWTERLNRNPAEWIRMSTLNSWPLDQRNSFPPLVTGFHDKLTFKFTFDIFHRAQSSKTIRSTNGEIFIWCVEEAVRNVNTTKENARVLL